MAPNPSVWEALCAGVVTYFRVGTTLRFTDYRTYIHTRIHTYIHTYMHTHIHTHTCIHTYIHTRIHTHIHAYTHTYTYTYTHTHTHTSVHIRVFGSIFSKCLPILYMLVAVHNPTELSQMFSFSHPRVTLFPPSSVFTVYLPVQSM